MLGATRANDFMRQSNEYGQARGDHPSSRTDPDNAERLTGIYGSEGWGVRVSPSEPRSTAWRSWASRARVGKAVLILS